ncbi:MAG: MaoC family dehydratase [Phyllobacteriaceae bacterium]|nr:MaoC family dehydratase [Phyllobacteriaceae bacterium]
MTLDEYLRTGETITLGSHTFQADEIKRFAAKFDPQPFHLDEAAARKSVFGGLCASGWHTVSMWMKLNIESGDALHRREWTGPGQAPEFGPSPGFRNLKWLKPVYVGDTVTYTRRVVAHRPLPQRPGWRLMELHSEGFNQNGEKVVEFDNAALLKAE